MEINFRSRWKGKLFRLKLNGTFKGNTKGALPM